MSYNYQFPPIIFLKNRPSAVFPSDITNKVSKVDFLQNLMSECKLQHLIIMFYMNLFLFHICNFFPQLGLKVIAGRVMTFFFFSITYTETQHSTKSRSKLWAYACSVEVNDSSSFHTPNTPMNRSHCGTWCLFGHFRMLVFWLICQYQFTNHLLWKLSLTTLKIISDSFLWVSLCFVHILIIVYTTSSAISSCMFKCSFFLLECEPFGKRIPIISFPLAWHFIGWIISWICE